MISRHGSITIALLEGAEIQSFERNKEQHMNLSVPLTAPLRWPAISQPHPRLLARAFALACLLLLAANAANSSAADDKKIVADLDTQYQAAVKVNDAATMDRILADDFILVVGSGKTYTKSDLLEEARSGRMHYEHQEDSSQTVRLWGDTAVVSAKLWEKGTDNGKPFDYTLWFSDTYVRTPTGWRYVFGQASSPLPKTA
jgi:ketosteroid isomerase-like protein